MSNDDMQDLYNFITGVDNAGNSWFGKALQDPDTVVRMAWFELNGEKMLQERKVIRRDLQKLVRKINQLLLINQRTKTLMSLRLMMT